MYYHFKIHNDDDGLWAKCIELEGCLTQGDTMEELRFNMREALNLYLDEPANSDIVHPSPRKNVPGKNIEKVQVDAAIAFAMLLRNFRKINKMSQVEMARKLEMKNVFSYQRLETKTDPRLSTIQKIAEVFPDFPLKNIF